MGGHGSGRYGARPTAEATDSRVLTMKGLRQKGLAPGACGQMDWHWPDGMQVSVLVDCSDIRAPYVYLVHRERCGDERVVSYRVNLLTTTPPWGGVRFWFLCPATGRRTQKLFLPRGGAKFLSRQGYKLGYATQRVGSLDRAHIARRRILAKLGDPDCPRFQVPEKPRAMRWATYDRLLDQLIEREARIDATWTAGAERILARVTRH